MENKPKQVTRTKGQALVEYALILALLVMALILVMELTGPAIGNLFGNTVIELRGATQDPANLPAEYAAKLTEAALNPLPILTEEPTPVNTPVDTPVGTPESTSEFTPEATPEVTPEITPEPTFPPTPIPDRGFDAPYLDTVDNVDRWRVSEEPWLGWNDWFGSFFVGPRLDYDGSTPATTGWNQEVFGAAASGIIDFPSLDYDAWKDAMSGPVLNWPSGSPYDNWSARFVREITVEEETTIRFNAQFNDGFRLWLLSPGQSAASCSATGVSSGEPGTANASYGDTSANPTDCLLIDDWETQQSSRSVVRTVPAGDYTLQVDYYEVSLAASLTLDISKLGNPDDTIVDASGIPTAGTVDCGWEQHAFWSDANSLEYDWTSYPDSAIPQYTRCYLEFRGWVYVPGPGNPEGLPALTSPEFVYWDLWDVDSSQTTVWLEFGEYIPNFDETALDRDAVDWIRVDLHNASRPTMNYNWTRNVISLTNVAGTQVSTGNTVTESYLGKKVAYRFVIENRNSLSDRSWYVDDVEFRDADDDLFPVNMFWDMDDTADVEDFLVSGQWGWNAANAVAGKSWGLQDTFGRYSRHTESPPALVFDDPDALRVHYIEFNGLVDTTLSSVDSEGDTGAPVLSFMHGYKIGRYTGLEVQYYDLVTNEWLPVPGAPGDPDLGIIEPITYAGTTYKDAQDMAPQTVSLLYVPQTQYRLRFAMTVHYNADRRYGGWWIDDIKLHRKDPEAFLDYPFIDDAESGLINWLPGGTWSRTSAISHSATQSFTDSPGEDYASGSNSSLRLVMPIDLNNDTPANLALTDRDPSGGNSGGAATAPYLTFYHRRDIKSNDALYLEYRLSTEDGTQWKPLWAYVYRMGTLPSDTSARTGLQKSWEFVRVDLSVIPYIPGGPDFEDDDILIGFRFYSDGWSEGDGVYIDDIRLEDYSENPFELWPLSDDRTIGGTALGTGNGTIYTADVDEGDWDARWRADGTWAAITWEQRQGLRAWHESANGQTAAPVYEDGGWSNAVMTPTDRFSVLELERIIDLRGAYQSDYPTLYFWSRYHLGANERIVVQISEELPASTDMNAEMAARCNNPSLPQCYEQVRGWSEWETTSFDRDADWLSTYSWQRFQVDLTPYASDGATPGTRIRIRFVYDSLDNSNTSSNRDGWYVDNISIEPRYDLDVLHNVSIDGPFEDDATNMANWVAEGSWGLSPQWYRVAGGASGFTGVWDEYFWDCTQCEPIGNNPGGATWIDWMSVGADLFLDVDGNASTIAGTYTDVVPVTRTVTNIDYDISTGSPYAGFLQTDLFAGRWVLNTTAVDAPGGIASGLYSIVIASDDGVRVKIQELDSYNGTPVVAETGNDAVDWNVIYNWSDHGRTTDMGVLALDSGRFYRFTIEWYDRADTAVLTVDTGSTAYSFTDSPKQGVGGSFPDIPTIANSNSSMILDGSIDLTGTTDPYLEYYTLYEIRGTARVEVSTDGGHTWTESGLQDPAGAAVMADPSWGNSTYMSEVPDWQENRHNLADYVDQIIMVRFRMDNDGYEVMDMTATYPNFVSWWVTDITIADGAAIPVVCGDATCDVGEDNVTCPSDCSPVCGNSVIETGETCDDGVSGNDGSYGGCNVDCSLAAFCGDGTCDISGGENSVTCVSDCPVATATPVDVCPLITYGSIQVPGTTMTLTIDNGTGSTIGITMLQVSWPDGASENGGLDIVTLDGNALHAGTRISSGPVTFPTDMPWSGLATNRDITDGATETLEFTFKKDALATGYSVTVTFSNGCSQTVSN
jgi:hypothetical protein